MSGADDDRATGPGEPGAEPEGPGHDGGAPAPEEPVAPHVDHPDFDRSTYVTVVRELGHWVDTYLVPVWVHSVSASAPWCTQWPQHRDAVSMLHALWLSWQYFIDTEQAGSVGPITWINTHLFPTMERLRSAKGPFAACMRATGRTDHRIPSPPLEQR
ncbi:DUF4913 domain-containing protein [Nocardiopsis halophila]|uniref:DUF4913 domain-containing protein n=1 Tax=Nocardiopsis halophila TaxID=141692 RepID=UPI000345BB34|nr:DUF4913 domain-containing protein [Nocardiopsis halophila]